jgi:hypothetical protein
MPHAEVVKKAWALREARGKVEWELDEARDRLAKMVEPLSVQEIASLADECNRQGYSPRDVVRMAAEAQRNRGA